MKRAQTLDCIDEFLAVRYDIRICIGIGRELEEDGFICNGRKPLRQRTAGADGLDVHIKGF